MLTADHADELKLWNMVGTNADLPEILACLIRFVEAKLTSFHAAVFLLHEGDAQLRLATPLRLPAALVEQLKCRPLARTGDASLTAVIRNEGIFIGDPVAPQTTTGVTSVAHAHGIRSEWAMPLTTDTLRLGVLALYSTQAGLPSEPQRKFLEKCARIAALAAYNDRRHRLHDAQKHLLSTIYDNVSDVLFSVTVSENHEFIFESANRRFFEATCLSAHQVIGLPIERVIPEPSLSLVKRHYEQAIRELRTVQWEETTPYPAGLKTGEVRITPILDDRGICTRLVGSVRDVTEHKILQQQLERTSRLYAALSQCNQAVVQSETDQQLFATVCETSVTQGGMRFAWIGLRDNATNLLKPVAFHGYGSEYIDDIKVSVDARNPVGLGPGGTAYREQRPVWCQDFLSEKILAPWRDRGSRVGWKSMAALPLTCDDCVIGVFFLYCDTLHAFDSEAQHLLAEMAMDISFGLTKHKDRRERLTEQADLQKLSRVVEQSHNIVVISDSDARITYVNPAFQRITGYSGAEVIGHGTKLLMSPQTPPSTYAELRSRLAQGKSWQGELVNVKKDGTEFICLAHVSPLRSKDGTVSSFVGVGHDITEQRKSEMQIDYLTNFDALSGLPNRTLLGRRFEAEIQRSPNGDRNIALMIFDLDQFKFFNEADDHTLGDKLIGEIGLRLQETIEDDGVACRLGGDEFAIMLPDVNIQQAPSAAQKLLAKLAVPYGNESDRITMSASVGIAIYPDDGADFSTLSRNAELAMYRAKLDGRGCWRLYTEALHTSTKRTIQIVGKLRRAIYDGALELHYQPQFASNRVVGAEALLRWTDPALGTVSPSEFIPIAEDSGLIIAIDDWVLRTAVRQTKEWLDAGMDSLVICVNASPQQFRSEGFCENLVQILDASGLPPQKLELEITEGTAMRDPENVVAVLRRLTDLGVRIAIDDFGVGYSSLSYLKRFKVHRLKIDKSFVRDLVTDENDRAIVATIISMAKHMGLEILAEGVETQEQLEYLAAHGCELAQGYLLSMPLPAAEFVTFWKAWKNRQQSTPRVNEL